MPEEKETLDTTPIEEWRLRDWLQSLVWKGKGKSW